MNAKITKNCHIKELAQNLKTYENNPRTPSIIN